jgi:NDP-sugar pyrophosphorylase family protein
MSFEAVVLAGGKGTRLSPFTYVLPKPLLPLGESPILDLVLTQLAREGCRKVTLAVGYLGHLIELYCGDGERWGLQVDYFREITPLGTMGALAHVPIPDEPFVVMNGDVLTDMAFRDLLDAHGKADAELTIGSFRRVERDELGIIESNGDGRVIGYREKPEHEYLVSMGIYALDPSVISAIPTEGRMDLPDLVHALVKSDRKVHTHVHSAFWLDLGRLDDFTRANEEADTIFERLGIRS